jgi:hypothetical protein
MVLVNAITLRKLPLPVEPNPQILSTARRKALKLRRNEFCPIHRSLYCCGREPKTKNQKARQIPVQRVEDPHHPRGYRELRSNPEMRKLLNRKIEEQDRECAICHEKFSEYSDVVPYADIGIRH